MKLKSYGNNVLDNVPKFFYLNFALKETFWEVSSYIGRKSDKLSFILCAQLFPRAECTGEQDSFVLQKIKESAGDTQSHKKIDLFFFLNAISFLNLLEKKVKRTIRTAVKKSKRIQRNHNS